MKKLLIVLLSLVSVVSVFAGGNRSTDSAASGKVTKKYTSLPFATDGKTTLTMYVAGATNNVVTSFDVKDNLFTQRIVRETGINLEIISEASGTTDQLSVLLNSGNYPDVINAGMSYDNMLYYAGQGILAPLDDYDPMGYPNIKAAYAEYPAFDVITRGTDGKLYALPSVNDCLHCTYQNGRIWYYMPWMRDNNIKQPQTLNEFTEYLRYVKSHDLNKNGKSDEIGVAFDKNNVLNFVSYIAKSYMPFVGGQYYGLAMENGKIVEQYKDSRFRDALKYIAGIYKEGLILSDSLTMSVDQLKGLLENPEPIVGVGGLSWLNDYVAWPGTRFMEHFVLPAVEGPNGQRNGSNIQPWNIMGAKWFVTDKAKDPGLAIALYDYLINLDVELDGYVGPKGQAWTDADPGALCMLGDAARFKMLMAFGNTPINISWGQANPMIRNIEWQLGEQATGVEVLQRWYETGNPAILQEATSAPIASGIGPWFITATQLSKYKMPDDLFIPLMALNDADNARVTDINAVLNSFKEQAISEFIIGARDINNNAVWNTYIAELDRLGSAELVRIRQKYIK